MKTIDISIIILSYNTSKLLENCLASIYQTVKNVGYEIIVVDNASQDDSVRMVEDKFTQVKLIINRENYGFGKANNQGAKIARGRYLMFLNSDTLVHSQAIKKMVEFIQREAKTGVFGYKLLNADGSDQASTGSFPDLKTTAEMLFGGHFIKYSGVMKTYVKTMKVDWVMGSAMVVRKGVFDEVGGFDEKIFMYIDEVELCYRIKKAGYDVMFYPLAKITHLGRGSSTSGKKAPILNIYRGLIYFYQKHYSRSDLFFLKLMLKLKALLALIVGWIKNDYYLKETYGEAIQIS